MAAAIHVVKDVCSSSPPAAWPFNSETEDKQCRTIFHTQMDLKIIIIKVIIRGGFTFCPSPLVWLGFLASS